MLPLIDQRHKYSLFFLLAFLLSVQAHADNTSMPANSLVSSVNLCTDQVLLELLPEERIESLSFLARDKQYSPNWKKAQTKPYNHAQLEELFLLKSDIVLISPYSAALMQTTLKKINKQALSFSSPSSLNELYQSIKQLSQKLNVPDSALIKNLAISKLINKPVENKAALKKIRVLSLAAGGYTIGSQTIEHELLIKAGFLNVAAEAGIKNFTALSLEEIVHLKPDIIFLRDTSNNKASASQRLLEHPILKVALQNTQFISDNSPFSACSVNSVLQRFKYLEQTYASFSA